MWFPLCVILLTTNLELVLRLIFYFCLYSFFALLPSQQLSPLVFGAVFKPVYTNSERHRLVGILRRLNRLHTFGTVPCANIRPFDPGVVKQTKTLAVSVDWAFVCH